MQSEPSNSTDNPLVNQTDAELFAVLRSGQTAVLGILYDRHSRLVYGLALKVLGNAQEAEDLTQDIFLTLARGCSYDAKRGSLRTFLAVLTRSRAIDRVRSRTTATEFMGKLQSTRQQEIASNPPLEYVSEDERSQEVRSALAQLSSEQQQILQMAYYDGLSQSEIAGRLSIPLGTVKARSRRGLLKLRETLKDFIR